METVLYNNVFVVLKVIANLALTIDVTLIILMIVREVYRVEIN